MPPNTQTIASHHANGLDFFGACTGCKRRVVIDMQELIAKIGPESLVVTTIKRMACKECGAQLDLAVSSPAQRGPG